ncbi:hypothetical protein [Streptomyces sp. NPDC102476]|uniref:hypothetical protein n=1 Tax=Streptomyces sp. NPDC102476 TaxID=3366181 RepID=UPI0037F2FA3B
MTDQPYPPAHDRLTHLIAQEINTSVDTWKLALWIARNVVKDPAVQAEIRRIGEAHAAGQPCGDQNCGHCFGAAAVSSAGVVQLPPTNQAALRAQVVNALYDVRRPGLGGLTEAEAVGRMADAVLKVLPAPVDRAAGWLDAAAECNRAGGAYAQRGTNDAASAAFALMETFLRKAGEAEYVATPCDPMVPCEDGGEPCSTHERLMGHAEGDHELCAPDCGEPWLRRMAAEVPKASGFVNPQTGTGFATGANWSGVEASPLKRAHVALAEQAGRDQAALTRVRELHDRLIEETDLHGPEDLLTRGSAARRIATALDGWNPSGAPQCSVEFENGARCAKPAGHRPPGSGDPHVPEPAQPHNDETQDSDPIETGTEAALGQAEERLRQVLAVAEVIEANGIGWAADSVRRAAKGELS